ncbi:hypothetical protein CHARACLAT_008059 [Characodon lateralis]|uniref:Uncharacterized protein n=1 Tax=Characodon lateralis TaxID=208331 RepID=A0ABU7DPY2_9TELE|nr:hypothetical protein [Characodon lateralis]
MFKKYNRSPLRVVRMTFSEPKSVLTREDCGKTETKERYSPTNRALIKRYQLNGAGIHPFRSLVNEHIYFYNNHTIINIEISTLSSPYREIQVSAAGEVKGQPLVR